MPIDPAHDRLLIRSHSAYDANYKSNRRAKTTNANYWIFMLFARCAHDGQTATARIWAAESGQRVRLSRTSADQQNPIKSENSKRHGAQPRFSFRSRRFETTHNDPVIASSYSFRKHSGTNPSEASRNVTQRKEIVIRCIEADLAPRF